MVQIVVKCLITRDKSLEDLFTHLRYEKNHDHSHMWLFVTCILPFHRISMQLKIILLEYILFGWIYVEKKLTIMDFISESVNKSGTCIRFCIAKCPTYLLKIKTFILRPAHPGSDSCIVMSIWGSRDMIW